MHLAPTGEAIGTVPRHFATPRTVRRVVDPPTFGLYRPGSLFPGEYVDQAEAGMVGADQPTLTDYSGTIIGPQLTGQ